METGTHLVFVNLDTDSVEDCAHETFVIDPNTAVMTDAEREILNTADHYGAFNDDAREIIRRIGVPMADLWAAYEWRRAFDRGMADAHLSTGVTYGSPDSALSVAYDMGRNYGELCDECAAHVLPDENPPCPVCQYPLSDHDVAGFPCDGCTESQPMGVWVSSWAGGES